MLVINAVCPLHTVCLVIKCVCHLCLLCWQLGWACVACERDVMINRILVGGSRGRRPLGRCRRGWEDVQLDLQEMGWEGVEWIDLAEDGDK
jgi:hypothetical protein